MEMRWSVNLAGSLLRGRPPLEECWDFSNALMMRALLSVYKITEDRLILKKIKRYADSYVSTDGGINGLNFDDLSVSQIGAGLFLVDMYRFTREERYKKASHFVWASLKSLKRTAEGVFFSENEFISPNTLYYAAPFYSGHISAFKYIKKYSDIIRQFMVVYNNLKDKDTGLLQNAYDRTKKSTWCSKKTGYSPCFCTVSISRFLVSLTELICCLDYSKPDSKLLMGIYRELVDSVLKYCGESGCFYLITDEAERKGNYLESYSTIMIFYAIVKGLNNNVIFGEKYVDAACSIYNGIIDEFVTVSQNGSININKTCKSEDLSDDLSFSYYVGLPIVSNEPDTISMFILSMAEYEKLRK